MAITKEEEQIEEISDLFKEACSKAGNRGDLLVACYEIAKKFHKLVRNALPKSKRQWKEWANTYDAICEQLNSGNENQRTPRDRFTLPLGFTESLSKRIDNCRRRSYGIPRLLHVAMKSLDESLRVFPDNQGDSPYQAPVSMGLKRVPSFCGSAEHYWLVPRPADWGPPWRTESGDHNLASEKWISAVSLIPSAKAGVEIRIGSLASHVTKHLHPQREVRTGVWSISRHFRPVLRQLEDRIVDYHGARHTIYSVSEPEEIAEYAQCFKDSILPQCEKQNVAILVLPELSVGPRLLEELRNVLRLRAKVRAEKQDNGPPRPVLVVAGSFHEPDRDSGGVCNKSMVLDYLGREARLRLAAETGGWGNYVSWHHRKLTEYRIKRQDVDDIKDEAVRAKLVRDLGLERQGVVGAVEPEQLGVVADVVDSPIGKMCVGICIDFLDTYHRWHDPLQRSWVDWYLVPAASPTTTRFKDPTDRWAFDGAATIIANACWLLNLFGTSGAADAVRGKVPCGPTEDQKCFPDCDGRCLWVIAAASPSSDDLQDLQDDVN